MSRPLILVGAKPPVSFFAYPDKPSWGAAGGREILHLAHAHEDGDQALAALAEALGAQRAGGAGGSLALPDAPTGKLNQYTVGAAIARHLPEGAIVSDEGATSGGGSQAATVTARPHDWLTLTGGSIGQGMPLATGAAVACPDRKVVCLQGDGGAMYTLQALWTQAREKLDVITVIFANRSYAILNVELARVGAQNVGPARPLHARPAPAGPGLRQAGRGHGRRGQPRRDHRGLRRPVRRSHGDKGPRLIEVVI